MPGMPALALMVWALALGVDMGGNLTPIGASANVVAYSIVEHGHGIDRLETLDVDRGAADDTRDGVGHWFAVFEEPYWMVLRTLLKKWVGLGGHADAAMTTIYDVYNLRSARWLMT